MTTHTATTPIILSEDLQERPYRHYEQSITSHIHHFYISEAVDAPELYTDMIFKIQTAGPDDAIYIHLNTPGGRLDTGVQLINAMQSTQAHVVCAIEGSIASLGTMIFLAADEWIVHDFSMMMFHNYSGGVFGKGHEQIAALNATTSWVDDLMSQLYIPFMSEDEWERIRRGEDLYFQADEIRERLATMVEIMEEEKRLAEEAEKEASKAEKEEQSKIARDIVLAQEETEEPIQTIVKRTRKKNSKSDE